MVKDIVTDFIAAREILRRERRQITERLDLVERALGTMRSAVAAPSSPAIFSKRQRRPQMGKKVKVVATNEPAKASRPARQANTGSAREIIQKVVAKGPLAIREIVDAMKKKGYVFQSKKPVNSVGAYLYSASAKKYFTKRADGKFSVKR